MPANKIKQVGSLIVSKPILNEAQMMLAQWAAKYYHHSLGDICFAMLPTKLRTAIPFQHPMITFWHLNDSVTESDISTNAKKQRLCIQLLSQSSSGLAETHLVQSGINKQVINRLSELGLIHSKQVIASEASELSAFVEGP